MYSAPNNSLRFLTSRWLSVGLVCAILASLSGCRSARDNQIDILESELRGQEDYIYELEEYIVEYSDKLQDCRCTEPHQIVVQEGTSAPDFVGAEPLVEPKNHTAKQPTSEEPEEEPAEMPPAQDEESPEAEPQTESETDPESIDVPDLEFEFDEPVGMREVPRDQLEVAEAMFEEDDAEGQLIYIPDPAEGELEAVAPTDNEIYMDDEELVEVAYEEEEDITIYQHAERIVITEILRGDEGEGSAQTLLAVVEARDSKNDPAELNGMVSLMVMTSDAAARLRLKRWDFSEEETIAAWQLSHLGDGLHLELPLGQAPLPNESVELWARLMTNDGRKLLARLSFDQSTLVTLDDRPENPDRDAIEQALAEAAPLESQTPELPPVVIVDEPEEPAEATTQWRASVQAAHLATGSYATNSSSSPGWKSQPASRQSGGLVQQATTTSRPTKSPVWATGRSLKSDHSTAMKPSSKAGTGWSQQR